jgi:uncharacterized OsmC-like protein
MGNESIRVAILSLRQQFSDHPENAIGADPYARACLTEGLETTVEGPSGQRVSTDMPPGVGGTAASPTPGWYVRAGIASCTVTVIAMRAAELQIPLRHLEVRVESHSNDCGMIGVDEDIPAGPLGAVMHVAIGGEGATGEALREIVNWGIGHSPMADLLTRSIPLKITIDTP